MEYYAHADPYEFRRRIVKLHDLLLELIDPNELILVKLAAEGVLSRPTQQQITSKKTDQERNTLLLEWLINGLPDVILIFLHILRTTWQAHIANLIDGSSGDECISATMRHRLDDIRPVLCELLVADDSMLTMLRSQQAISEMDFQRIQIRTENYQRNSFLVDVLRRCGEFTMKCFYDALDATYQSELKHFVQKGQVVKLRMLLNHETAFPLFGFNVYEHVTRLLSDNFRSRHIPGSSSGTALDNVCCELRKHDLHLLGIRRDRGILIYIHGSTSASLKTLCYLVAHKNISALFQDACNRVFVSSFLLTVTVDIPHRPDYDESLRLLQTLADKENESAFGNGVSLFEQFPASLLPAVLMRAAVLLFNTLRTTTTDIDVGLVLASVSRSWSKVIADRKHFGFYLRHYINSRPTPLTCDPYSFHVQRLTRLHIKRLPVGGLTCLNGKLFLVYRNSNIIHVCLDQSEPKLLPFVEVASLVDPRGMSSCSETSLLYVLDGQTVWQVTLEGSASKWLETDDILSMSITSGRLLIATSAHCLVVYATTHCRSSAPLTTIYLPHANDVAIVRALETAHGTFIILCESSSQEHKKMMKSKSDYWKDTTFSIDHAIEVNYSGAVLQSYTGRGRGLAADATIDSTSGHMIVADSKCNRIVLLNEKLELERVLLNKKNDGIISPRRVHYVSETGHLLVGMDNGYFDMYNLRTSQMSN